MTKNKPYKVKRRFIFPASGVHSDVETLLQKFVNTNSIRYEEFLKIWKENNFSLLQTGRHGLREKREFVEEAFKIVLRFILPPFSLQVRVGAIYTMFGIYHSQRLEPKVRVRIPLAWWTHIVELHDEVKTHRHLDVDYIIRKMKDSDRMFEFVAYPSHLSMEELYRDNDYDDEDSDEINDSKKFCKERKELMIDKLLDEEQITQFEAVHQKYHELKCMSNSNNGGDSKLPGPSLNLISDDVVNSIKVIVEGQGTKNDATNSDHTNNADNSNRADAMKALKYRAMSNEVTLSSHMRYLNNPEENNGSPHPQYVIPDEVNTQSASNKKTRNRKGSLQRKLDEVKRKMPYYELVEDVKPCSKNNHLNVSTENISTNDCPESDTMSQMAKLTSHKDSFDVPTSSKRPRKRSYPTKQNAVSVMSSDSPPEKRAIMGRKSKENAQLRMIALTNGDDVDLGFHKDTQISDGSLHHHQQIISSNDAFSHNVSSPSSVEVNQSSNILTAIPEENVSSSTVLPTSVGSCENADKKKVLNVATMKANPGENSNLVEISGSTCRQMIEPTSPVSTTGSSASVDSSSAISGGSAHDDATTPSNSANAFVPTIEDRLKLPLTTGKLVAIAPIGKYIERPLIGRVVQVFEETLEIEWLMGSYSTKWAHWTVGRGVNKYILTEPISKERVLASDFELTESKKLPNKVRKSLRKMYMVIDGN